MTRSSALLSLVWVAALLGGCGSKTGILSSGVSMDAGVADAPVMDTAVPDAFDTFPCRWSYGQPIVLGTGSGVWGNLAGAVHGALDTVWVYGEDLAVGDGRVGERLSLGDPPRVLEAPASLSQPQLHGLPDGWTALASDCSLAFFDDDGRPRRLVLPADGTPPCILEKRYSGFIDVSFGTTVLPRAVRYTSDGEAVHDVPTPTVGTSYRTVVSPEGRLAAAFVRERAGDVIGVLVDVVTRMPIAGPVSLGRSDGDFAVSVDRLRPAALVLLSEGTTSILFRLPFDGPLRFEPEVIASAEMPIMAGGRALVTNETEALMAQRDGSIAIQPLSGSALRFLEPPDPGVESLEILLAPGESRGGVLYSHLAPGGGSLLSFRMLVCNR